MDAERGNAGLSVAITGFREDCVFNSLVFAKKTVLQFINSLITS